jgi:hypothetical protein
VISEVRYQAIGLRSTEPIAPGASVQVRTSAGDVTGEVRRCIDRDGLHHITIGLRDAHIAGASSERKDQRRAASIEGTLRDLRSPGSIYAITIVDVSRAGLRVRSPMPLDPGTPVEIRCPQAVITGEIRYSREHDFGAFHLGIQASEGSTVAGQSGPLDLTALVRGA